jgi:hypothetical protein
VVAAVGLPSGVNPPTVIRGQPPLTSNGKPQVLFIGAEFCPLCAAERWAMVMAFSRFGTFSGLKETTSSPWDTPPAVATFSTLGSTYSSPYFTFVPVEHETNDRNGLGVGRGLLMSLNTAQQNLWSHYSSQLGIQTGYPFVDFGNKVFVSGPSYDPATLEGLTQDEISVKLTHPSDPVTQAIVGTASYLTAAVCSLTNQQPASACSASAVHSAATKMGLS